MNSEKTIQAWFDCGRLVRPSAETANFVDLVGALHSLAGGEGVEPSCGAQALAQQIGKSEHYVFILVDGMGAKLMGRLPAGGFLRSHLAAELQAVFPSATAAALTTVATGLWPAAHGVPTWWVYLEQFDLAAVTLPFTQRWTERPLGELGVNRKDVFPLPGIWSRINHSLLAIVRHKIKDSVFTDYATGGKERVGYDGLPEALEITRERIARAQRPTFIYLYVPDLDHLCHEKGAECEDVQRLLLAMDKQLGDFCEALAGRARIVITADHGEVNVPDERRFVIDEGDALLEHLRFPATGEPTVPVFHVKPGSEDAFLKAFARRFGDAFCLITAEEAESLQLLGPGPLSPVTRRRLGDFIGIAPAPAAIYFKPPDAKVTVHVGVHGGLTPDEMLIPLILA
ncbi:MAG: alkaline phosphatase family protein [Planctomycetia bacterium]|nr:alkaline phosphatase family protein [Planctomycetia bacterium]